IAQGAITGGADTRTRQAAQLLDVQVKEFSRSSTFVALNGRFWSFERREPLEAVAAQDAGNGGLGGRPLQHQEDLRVGAALPAQGKDVSFELGSGSARLPLWDGGTILKLRGKARFTGAGKPATDSPFA